MEIYNRPWPLVPNKVRADGGRELDRFRGVEHPADTPNGAEAWVGSLTRANGATSENPNLGYAEVILPDGTRDFLVNVVKRAPETILGKKHMEKYGTSLGMLIKMLDAKAPFLLQCHPTRENARKYWNSRFGKEECWYVLGTRKDVPEPPYILLGFKEDITREKFEAAYRKGDAARRKLHDPGWRSPRAGRWVLRRGDSGAVRPYGGAVPAGVSAGIPAEGKSFRDF